MTRRERKEWRLARRLEWAAGRDRKANAAFEGVRRIADNIPLGQPILVGHHSERHARKDAERIDNGMRRGVESQKMAQHHRSVAGGIERQLDTSIFADDPDAVERLRERIAEAERMVTLTAHINKAWRKGGIDELRRVGRPDGTPWSEKFLTGTAKTMADAPWLRTPLSTTSLRAAIRRDREKLAAALERAEQMARVRETLAREDGDRDFLTEQ